MLRTSTSPECSCTTVSSAAPPSSPRLLSSTIKPSSTRTMTQALSERVKPMYLHNNLNIFIIKCRLCSGGAEDGEDDLDRYIVRDEAVRKYMCSICGKVGHKSRSNVRNHIESKHFPGRYQYPCSDCTVVFNTRTALAVHKSTYHKKPAFEYNNP